MMKKFFFLSLTVCSLLVGCSDDDDNNGSNCLADALTLTETAVDNLAPSSDNVIITFDAKNTSSSDYTPTTGGQIFVKIIVTTSDNATYESTHPITVSSLSAGATASTQVLASYGAGKT